MVTIRHKGNNKLMSTIVTIATKPSHFSVMKIYSTNVYGILMSFVKLK